MLLKLYSSSVTMSSSLCYCSMGSSSWAGSAQAQSSTAQLFHWNGLLNPTTKCVPCSFTRGFNNLHWPRLLAVSLGSSCVPLLLLSFVPHPSSSRVISAPWSLSWLLQGTGQPGLASCLSGLWASASLSIFGCQLWLGLHLAPGSRFCAWWCMGWKRPTGKLGSSKRKPPPQGPEQFCSAALHRISLSNLWHVLLMLTAGFWHSGRASGQTDWTSPLSVTCRIQAHTLRQNRDSYCFIKCWQIAGSWEGTTSLLYCNIFLLNSFQIMFTVHIGCCCRKANELK